MNQQAQTKKRLIRYAKYRKAKAVTTAEPTPN